MKKERKEKYSEKKNLTTIITRTADDLIQHL